MKGIKTVVIDAGHGGKDPGCHGKHSNEKTVTLNIALKLGKAIEKSFPDINVIYTRKTDVFVELNERAAIANKNNADLFICIHANSGPEAAFGAETYVLGLHRTEAQRKIAERENSVIEFENADDYEELTADAIIARSLQLSVYLDHSINLAVKIQDEFEKLKRHNRGVRQAGFLVLYKTTMPSVLIETGFLTNPKEENFLADTASQTLMASSLFEAFKKYKVEYEGADLSVNSTINGIDTTLYGLEEAEVKKEEVIFKVQIETSETPLDVTAERFQNMPVKMYQSGGLYKYTVGLFRDIDSANKLKAELRKKGFEHAFVVAFQGSERIDLNKAIKLVEN
ncbi:N-acetylmuramoyl-L-alanine amidase [Paracrocinitomix mangrovi]|uniref:N-acetylmuramoyl-L-alanine amidase family protein n=1 Tax=Paracrocinitomix mangrovi TaxID=2862509 RepID=UPI001C8EB71E|nr:N-acetylmuramoyl-L-alanine amidase [Paracrocinitomix mangrovi]UKN02457.1 N-acetylmuramoyl-L-alanine amidase [Paracrocinitomix mangrovi]